jgi:predicted SPOUT superfamily RNA methylase MTH1
MLQREEFDLRIGTSRYGTPVEEFWSEISKSLNNVESVLIVFGSPRRGLQEILSQEGKKPMDLFHFFVNTVPSQQVATVRTEEALFITLGMLNEMKLK